jgi:hypothetical protein
MTTQPISASLLSALSEVYATASDAYPEEQERIARGFKLAAYGHVQESANGYLVLASKGTGQYAVGRGVCDCPDFRRAKMNRCKHRWAVALLRRAVRLQAETPGYYHWESVLLGKQTLADIQRRTDGNLAAKVCGC